MNKFFNTFLVSIFFLALAVGFQSCLISYKFNGSLIDYSVTKSISIADFPNTAELVYPQFSQIFSEKLRDVYSRQTRLQLLQKGGDLHLEGEIVGYQLTPMAIGADSYASQTKLTVSIKVRFSNNKNPEEDLPEKIYTAFQVFDSGKMLTDVQQQLVTLMTAEIVDNIYNDTVGKW